MFPFAGAVKTVSEARRFYSLFNSASAGTPSGGPASQPLSHPTEPALNIDTSNSVPLTAPLQFITGPGHHGALQPIMGDIVGFFMRNLESGRNLEPGPDADHPLLPPPAPRGAPTGPPKGALQVTPTGQVATSYPGSATVFSLNLKRAQQVIPEHRPGLTGWRLTAAIRKATGAVAQPGVSHPDAALLTAKNGPFQMESAEKGVHLRGALSVPDGHGRNPAVLLLVPHSISAGDPVARAEKAEFDRLSAAGNVVLAMTPTPSPPGTDDMKSPILGPFYLVSLRADLVGRTLVGLRSDDVIHMVDYLAARPDVDARNITALGSGHIGLVLLHAAVLDPRLKRITVDHVLASYESLLHAPLPVGAPEDIIPGVLLQYDLPDLAGVLGGRLTETEPLQGTADLSQRSTPA